ncbi:hypothetical protein ACOSQ2_003493 [Xanthoceras sorbifolium]
MISEDFLTNGPIMVKGRPIFISVEAINEYFGLETDTTLMDGLAPNPNFTHYNEELATDLRRNGEPTWNSKSSIMRHAELRLDSAFWNVFVCHSLLLRRHRATITQDLACVLYIIRHDLPINIGYIIKQEIAVIACTKVGCLSFPSLITYFCAAIGIDVYGSNETILPPLPNLDRRTYNELASNRNEPQLFVYHFDRRGRARVDEEVVGAARHEGAEEQQPPPPRATAMMGDLRRHIDTWLDNLNE